MATRYIPHLQGSGCRDMLCHLIRQLIASQAVAVGYHIDPHWVSASRALHKTRTDRDGESARTQILITSLLVYAMNNKYGHPGVYLYAS
jgi:hypothetical protein